MNNEFDYIFYLLKKWGNRGTKILDSGTELICNVELLAPKAWLHKIYAKLSNEKIIETIVESGFQLPVDYIEFLKYANGLNIFSDSLSIWGIRTSYARTGDDAFQPYDVIPLNEEKKGIAPDGWIYFGSYSWDGSEMLYDLDRSDRKVYRCECGAPNIIQEWDNINVWLLSEVERLSKLFDEKGYPYDEDVPTIPIL